MSATKVRDYDQLAFDILKELGGEKNIISVARCATRLRVVTESTPEHAKENISKLPGVITVIEKGGQIQIVIGTNVDKVYAAFTPLIGSNKKSASHISILNRIIATMSAVFAPFIYIIAAAGILQGILILITLLFPTVKLTGAYQIFSFISWAPFAFLPIFIAITASQHFKCNLYIAVACCAALLSPTWAELATLIKNGEPLNFFGITLSETTYMSTVLPPLFLVWILSYLEHFLERYINNVIKPLLTPLICLVIMVPLTLIIVGPITAGAAHYIADSYNWLVELAPSVAGGLIGAVWQVFVIFGVHWGITPVVMANYEVYGRDSFQAFQTIAVIGQVGAALGFYLKSKNRDLKTVSFSAFITGIFGITEPAIYGINLRFKKPFIYGCLSAAIGGIVAGLFTPFYFAFAGLPGILTIVNGINEDFPSSIIGIIIGSSIALFGPVILMQLFGTGETKENRKIEDNNPKLIKDEALILSPLTGDVIPLDQVPDSAFAEKMMGDGVAIIPTDNHVYAPFSGKVTATFDSSKHAIGLTSDEGIELLIHIGLDTVNLTNNEFNYHVTIGQTVKQGDLLITFNPKTIAEAGYSTVTPIVILNSAQYQQIEATLQRKVTPNDILLTIKP
ncbi:glucose PTS transporter subunit IIA [Orbaceae bacterium ESL0721]|nr:glucose PTS transporter subunit IIA [Orbaceae bacterium ESL0721]